MNSSYRSLSMLWIHRAVCPPCFALAEFARSGGRCLLGLLCGALWILPHGSKRNIAPNSSSSGLSTTAAVPVQTWMFVSWEVWSWDYNLILKYLLSANWKISDINCFLAKLSSGCPNLAGITLSGWKGFTSDHLTYLVDNMHKLQRLDLSSINVCCGMCLRSYIWFKFVSHRLRWMPARAPWVSTPYAMHSRPWAAV